MTMPSAAISTIDPNDTDSRGVSFAGCLPTGDSLSSCAVSIVSGTCTLSATVGGTYATTASAGVTGNEAIVWITAATAGPLVLLFRGTSAQGRILDQTRTLAVQSR